MVKVEELMVALVENSPGDRDYLKALELIQRARSHSPVRLYPLSGE
jgi:hypothetical protein